MNKHFAPAINIIRDESRELSYQVTPNAEKVAAQIANNFKKGFHAFTIIGSYGTGKSIFLWALQKSLTDNKKYFDLNLVKKNAQVGVLQVIGQYQSIISAFEDRLQLNKTQEGQQDIFDRIFEEYEKNDLLLVYIDEFGKFLEYASKHDPEKELYFLQQLAEFANDPDRNIILITTLHQSFEAYANGMIDESQRMEWRKVKGRFKDITFNEPTEHLLYLAAKKFDASVPSETKNNFKSLQSLIKENHIFNLSSDFADKVGSKIYPLDSLSAVILTNALQKYGQNERSLFTFMESEDWTVNEESGFFTISNCYDYLLNHFYSYLNSAFNSHHRQWAAIQNGIERVEIELNNDELAKAILKTIGLLQLFSSEGAQINHKFLEKYFQAVGLESTSLDKTLERLQSKKILQFRKYNQSFRLFEGTDVDVDEAILKASESIESSVNLVNAINEYFNLPLFTAKEITYKKGTPRIFDFKLSEAPLTNLKPEGPIDGYINLILNPSIEVEDLILETQNVNEAILFGYYSNTGKIKNRLFEIQKTKQAIIDHQEDNIAVREMKKVLQANTNLLNHEIYDGLYAGKVKWFFQGKELKEIKDKKSLNRHLSNITEEIYHQTPTFNNELVNRHKVSSSIHLARKNYFQGLYEHWKEQDLGFDSDKFPPEKTLYITLLRENGIHHKAGGNYDLGAPNQKNGFDGLWKVSEDFLNSSRVQKKEIGELLNILNNRPFKLKQGLIDLWIPSYLFIKRGDFALYRKDQFVPVINDAILYQLVRNPDQFQVKAFEITDLRKKVLNRFREFLQLDEVMKPDSIAYIESIKPFLTFYTQLHDYNKNTKRLSKEASALREAITKATDPEKTFFEDFPRALGFDFELQDTDDYLQEFARKLNETVLELKSLYDQLINRIKLYIQEEIVESDKAYPYYRDFLINQFSGFKEHQLLNHQTVFLNRIDSKGMDRDSWISAVAHVLLNKPLTNINDKEEEILKDKFSFIIKELNNLKAVYEVKTDNEDAIKVDITADGTTKANLIKFANRDKDKVKSLADKIGKELNKNQKLKNAVIAELIKRELQ